MAKIGYGASVEVNDGTGDAFQALNEITNITVPSPEVATVESTHLNSTNRTRTYVVGLTEPGEFSVEQNYADAEYTRLVGLRGTSKSWKVIAPDTDFTASFTGVITKVEMQVSEELMKMTTTVKVMGPVTLT